MSFQHLLLLLMFFFFFFERTFAYVLVELIVPELVNEKVSFCSEKYSLNLILSLSSSSSSSYLSSYPISCSASFSH